MCKRSSKGTYHCASRAGMMPGHEPYRFKTNFNRSVKTEVSRGPRVEVITGIERRGDWTDEEKLSIIMESCRDGVVISDAARRHDLKPQQLFTWRNEFRRQHKFSTTGRRRLRRYSAAGHAAYILELKARFSRKRNFMKLLG